MADAVPSDPGPQGEERHLRLRGALDRFRNRLGVPAAFAGVVEADGDADVAVVGVRRRGSGDPAGPGDRVHIGSCGKMITAALWASFVESGHTDWDTPIAALCPDLAGAIDAGWQQRTCTELLHCSSGMMANPPRHCLATGYRDTRALTEQRTELAHLALARPPRRPGRFVYSNMGYIVLGAAIDRLSGGSFEQALATRLLEPLGIESAGYGPPPELSGHGPRLMVRGLALGRGKAYDPGDREGDNPPVLSSAGTLHVRVDDWVRVLRLFLRGGSRHAVLQQATIERLLTLPPGGPMAMGWARAQLPGVGAGAQGSNARWSATALMDEARRRTGFLVCNDGRTRVLMQSVPFVHRLLSG